LAFVIFILFIIALIYFLKRNDRTTKINMNHGKPILSSKAETNSTSAVPNSSVNQHPDTSHQQRYEDRRLIERRRIHHNSKELHKQTQIKKYEIKEDNHVGSPYFPKSNKFYYDSSDDDLGDYLNDKRNTSRYDFELNEHDKFDRNVFNSDYERDSNPYEYDRETTHYDHDNAAFDHGRYEYENNDYGDRDY
jgi:hypothetical protein